MKISSTLYKAFRKLINTVNSPIYNPIAKINFYFNGINYKKGLNVNGIMKVHVTRRGLVDIGENFKFVGAANIVAIAGCAV